MAEIRVEPPRRGRGWILMLLALLIAGGLAWYFLIYQVDQPDATPTTSLMTSPLLVAVATGG